MLTDDLLTKLADLVVALRHHEHPDRPWDRAGVIANLRKIDDTVPAHRVAYAAIKTAADPRCDTPGVLPLDGAHWNRGVTCPRHPTAGMRPDGECAGHWIDRQPEPPGFVRTGVHQVPEPIAVQVRETLHAGAIERPPVRRESRAVPADVRAELDAIRPAHPSVEQPGPHDERPPVNEPVVGAGQ